MSTLPMRSRLSLLRKGAWAWQERQRSEWEKYLSRLVIFKIWMWPKNDPCLKYGATSRWWREEGRAVGFPFGELVSLMVSLLNLILLTP
jgi:hypothetical protein